jgi:hypothetical protein
MGFMNARRLVLAIVVSLSSLGAGMLLAAPAALAEESCPNAASRQGSSVNLPECRVYEQVTPVNKGDAEDMFSGKGQGESFGLKADNHAYVAEDGDAVLLKTTSSIGPQAPTLNAGYVFSRGVEGWSTTVLTSAIEQPQAVEAEAFDPGDLSRVGFNDKSGVYGDLFAGNEAAFRSTNLVGPVGGPYTPLHSVSGNAVFAPRESIDLVGGSEDLSRVLVASTNHLLAPGAEAQDAGTHALYEWAGGGECSSTASGCKLVNVDSEGKLLNRCGAVLGSDSKLGGTHGAVSSDGSRIFFTVPDPGEKFGVAPAGPGCWNRGTSPQENPPEVYMREGGRTVEISVPEEGVNITAENPMRPAVFVGTASDASKVFFVTRTELTKDDTGHAAELYEYNTEPGVGEKALTRISRGETGTAEGNVDFVGAIPSGGSAVYFTAFGDLAKGASAYTEGAEYNAPVNLYRYDILTGTTTYITTLNQCDPHGCQGGFQDPPYNEEFPNHAAFYGEREAAEWYTTGDGQFLVFGTNRPITGFDNTVAPNTRRCADLVDVGGSEPEQCQELYRYDAATNSVVCVSCAGGAPIDNAMFARSAFPSPAVGPPRPISEDGKDVFFDSASALVSQAAPGRVHVYEWHEGTISMISSPSDPGEAFFLGSSANGANVFFTTHAQLAPQDTDVSGDIYDARIDGGFAGIVAPQCTGTGCQGVPAATPIFATPASVTFEGVGNFPASEPSSKPASKPKSKPKRCRTGFVRRKHGRCVKVAKRARKSARGRK